MPYTNTLIRVAEDCPVAAAAEPKMRGGKKSGVNHEFEVLSQKPYHYNNDELIFEVYLFKKGISAEDAAANHDALWGALFKKEHPCMRASSLTKRYGWGAHYNEDGKIALYPMESVEYQQYLEDPDTTKLMAMRSKRKK